LFVGTAKGTDAISDVHTDNSDDENYHDYDKEPEEYLVDIVIHIHFWLYCF